MWKEWLLKDTFMVGVCVKNMNLHFVNNFQYIDVLQVEFLLFSWTLENALVAKNYFPV